MRLLQKKRCNLCGKNKGFIGTVTLKDGTILCANCVKKAKFPDLKFKYELYQQLSEMNLKECCELIRSREENLQTLKSFHRTKSFCDCIQIDEESKKIVFADNLYFNNKNLLYTKNPQVFEIEDLVVHKPIYYVDEKVKGIMKKYIRADIEYFVGVKNPYINGFKMKIKKGVKCNISKESLNPTVFVDPEIDELQGVLAQMYEHKMQYMDSDKKGEIEEAFEDLYFEKMKLAKEQKYLEEKEIREILQIYYFGNRHKIRRARKRYGL